MDTAKIFVNGHSQAIRLPKAYRFKGKEVFLRKVGKMLVVIPKNERWKSLRGIIDMFPDDFMADGRNQPGDNDLRKW